MAREILPLAKRQETLSEYPGKSCRSIPAPKQCTKQQQLPLLLLQQQRLLLFLPLLLLHALVV